VIPEALVDWLRDASGGVGSAAITALRVVLIAVVAWVLAAVSQRAIRAFRVRLTARLDDREQVKRAETLGRVFRYLATVIITLVAAMLILNELGVSIAPILGAAGVVGLAIGFGAQSLVRDYFTGFFVLLENQIRQGDVVRLGDHAGLVEEMTLRYVRLRDYDGNVHYVPNGEIKTVVNMARDHAQAVVDVGVAYREDVDEVLQAITEIGRGLREDTLFAPRILGDLEIAGVEKLDDFAVVIRCRFKVLPLEQWGVKRELLKRLKAGFDARGIEIPFPYRTLVAAQPRKDEPARFPIGRPDARPER
jgi:small-conductance mechanosensitive channel